MKKVKKTRLFNFLIELLMVIVIFAVSSIIVVKMFYHGYDLVDKNKRTNDAMLLAGNIAEQMRLYDGQDLDEYLDYANDAFKVEISVDKECQHYCRYQSDIKVSDDVVEVSYQVESVGVNHE